jgi:hypothetical protein
MDMARTPVPAFAAPHKIWYRAANMPAASLQSSHAEERGTVRQAGRGRRVTESRKRLF